MGGCSKSICSNSSPSPSASLRLLCAPFATSTCSIHYSCSPMITSASTLCWWNATQLLLVTKRRQAWPGFPWYLPARLGCARACFNNQPGAVARAKLLEPALAMLGFAAHPVRASGQRNLAEIEPDYRLYARAGDGSSTLALCLAYPWGRYLDGKDDQRDSETSDENPGAVVV